MNYQRQIVLGFLITAFLVLLGIFFRAFLFENIIQPIYILILLIYQLLISVDQKTWWILFSLSILLYVFYRWVQQPSVSQLTPTDRKNVIMQRINYWQTSLHLTRDEIDQPNELRKDLIYIMADVYAQQYNNLNTYEIKSGLRNGHIPLPHHIHAFLFPEIESSLISNPTTNKNKVRTALNSWYKKVTRQNVKEYYRSIEEVLVYIESILEKK